VTAVIALLAALAAAAAPAPARTTAAAGGATPTGPSRLARPAGPASTAGKPGSPPAAEPSEIPVPMLGTLTDFGTWSVGCDNTLRCTAVSQLEPRERRTWVVVRREGAPRAEPEVVVATSEPLPATLAIDGKPVPVARRQPPAASQNELLVEPRAVRALLEQALAGKRLAALDPAGEVIGTVPLLDLADALRAVDEAQHREGTVTALVSRGKKPAAAVPPAPAAPVVVVRPLPPPRRQELTAGEMAALGAVSGCTAGAEAGSVSAAPLDADRALVLVVCLARTSGTIAVPLVITRAGHGWVAERPRFDYPPPQRYGDGPALADAGWDHREAALSDGTAGGAHGQRTWAWDGAVFRLVAASAPGAAVPIPIWRAVVRAR